MEDQFFDDGRGEAQRRLLLVSAMRSAGSRFILGYTPGMKIAVSIPDDVFHAAEELARRERCSRSSLYARALRRLLAEGQDDEITERLNEVYRTESSELDPVLQALQARALASDR